MFSDFDKLFNEFEKMMFNPSYGKRRTYKGDDGLYYITTYYNRNKPTTEDKIEYLKNELDRYVELQDFETAVKVRDQIKKLETNKDSIDKLNLDLEESIKNQDYEKCIELRDKISSLK
jgi:protein-arginine kinase activator protein McsA